MTIFIVIIHIIACFVLILVILLQAGRGSGLSWGAFGGTPQSFLGTKSASFLAKATTICAIVFLLTCITLNILDTQKSKSLFQKAGVSQMDVNKLKDVLEKIKAEPAEGTAASEASAAASETAQANAPATPAEPVQQESPAS